MPSPSPRPKFWRRLVLGLQFTPQQVAHMRELAERNNAGELNDTELGDLQSYVHVGNFLSLAHSKARLSLKNSESQPQ